MELGTCDTHGDISILTLIQWLICLWPWANLFPWLLSHYLLRPKALGRAVGVSVAFLAVVTSNRKQTTWGRVYYGLLFKGLHHGFFSQEAGGGKEVGLAVRLQVATSPSSSPQALQPVRTVVPWETKCSSLCVYSKVRFPAQTITWETSRSLTEHSCDTSPCPTFLYLSNGANNSSTPTGRSGTIWRHDPGVVTSHLSLMPCLPLDPWNLLSVV